MVRLSRNGKVSENPVRSIAVMMMMMNFRKMLNDRGKKYSALSVEKATIALSLMTHFLFRLPSILTVFLR